MTTPKNVNRLYSELLSFVKRMNDARRLLGVHERSIRLNAYRAARRYCELQTKHHNEFIRLLLSYDKTPEQLVDEWFSPLEKALDESPHALITAVSAGMTEREWMKNSALSYLDQKRRDRRKTAAAKATAHATTPAPAAELDTGTRLAQFELREAEREQLLNQQRAAIRELEAENTRLRKELAAVRLRLNRLQKELSAATSLVAS